MILWRSLFWSILPHRCINCFFRENTVTIPYHGCHEADRIQYNKDHGFPQVSRDEDFPCSGITVFCFQCIVLLSANRQKELVGAFIDKYWSRTNEYQFTDDVFRAIDKLKKEMINKRIVAVMTD